MGGRDNPQRITAVSAAGFGLTTSTTIAVSRSWSRTSARTGHHSIEQDVQRSPHRDPSADRQAFLQDHGEMLAGEKGCDEIADHYGCSDESDADHEADAASAQELSQASLRSNCAILEELAYGILQGRRLLGRRRLATEVDDQAEGHLGAQLPCPFDDELLGARVEIRSRNGAASMELNSCFISATCTSSVSRCGVSGGRLCIHRALRCRWLRSPTSLRSAGLPSPGRLRGGSRAGSRPARPAPRRRTTPPAAPANAEIAADEKRHDCDRHLQCRKHTQRDRPVGQPGAICQEAQLARCVVGKLLGRGRPTDPPVRAPGRRSASTGSTVRPAVRRSR